LAFYRQVLHHLGAQVFPAHGRPTCLSGRQSSRRSGRMIEVRSKPFERALPGDVVHRIKKRVEPGLRIVYMDGEKLGRSGKRHGNQPAALVVDASARIAGDIVEGPETLGGPVLQGTGALPYNRGCEWNVGD